MTQGKQSSGFTHSYLEPLKVTQDRARPFKVSQGVHSALFRLTKPGIWVVSSFWICVILTGRQMGLVVRRPLPLVKEVLLIQC